MAAYDRDRDVALTITTRGGCARSEVGTVSAKAGEPEGLVIRWAGEHGWEDWVKVAP